MAKLTFIEKLMRIIPLLATILVGITVAYIPRTLANIKIIPYLELSEPMEFLTSESSTCGINSITIGSQGTCDPITNTYIQEFIIDYTNDGFLDILSINVFHLSDAALSPSPMSVFYEFPAHGDSINVTFRVRSSGGNTSCAGVNLNVPVAFKTRNNCFSGTVTNDNCTGAIPLDIGSLCTFQLFDLTGATESSGSGINEVIECNDGGEPYVQDIWFSLSPPSSELLEITTSGIEFIKTRYEVYSGSCSNLTYEQCIEGSGPLRIPAGEVWYLRLFEFRSDLQEAFNICVTSVCPDQEELSDIIGDTLRIENHIKISADNALLDGSDVIYDAGQCIDLKQGFEVEQGALFEAVIDGCYDQNPDCRIAQNLFSGDYRLSFIGDNLGSFDVLFLDTAIISLDPIPHSQTARRVSDIVYYPDFNGGYNIPPFLVEFTCTEILIEPFTTTIGCGETIFLSGAHVSGYDITSTYDIMDDSEILINIVDMYTGGLDCNVQPKILQVKLTKAVSP